MWSRLSSMNAQMQALFERVPLHWKATALLRAFGFLKIPLLFAVGPKVVELSDERIVLRIPLNRKTRNHLRSMYFGTLAIGADCVVGMMAMHHLRKSGGKVHLSFKDFRAEFLKRPEGHVLFVCEEGRRVAAFVQEILKSGERGNLPVNGYAAVESNPAEPVMRFTLTLSLKRKP